jgi:3-hydroxypropanoate dehydrogenase
MAAPATAIIAYDLEFYEKLPLLVPHRDARSDFVGKPELIPVRSDAQRDAAGGLSHHRGARARARLRTDGGFDHDKVDAEFFPEGTIKSNFLCNLGYGDPPGCARAHRGLRSRTPVRFA